MASKKKSGYGKRPAWQWVLIYLVIGGAIYFVVYYFFFAGDSSYGTSGNGLYGRENTTESATQEEMMEGDEMMEEDGMMEDTSSGGVGY